MAGAKVYTERMAMQDQRHINMAYVLVHDALNELNQIYLNDSIMAHVIRHLGAMEDTLFEYVGPARKKEAK